MKLMKHPKHGLHHTYSPQEEEDLRKNGWVDADVKPVKVFESPPKPAFEPVAQPEAPPVRNKPGPKPKFQG